MENGTGKSSKCGNPVCCPLLFSGRCLSRISCVFKEALRNEKKYKVSYEVIAKNIRPEVQVILLDE